MGFDAGKAARDISSTFKFKRVGDGFAMEITDIDDPVDIDDKENGTIRGVARFLAIKGKIRACVGGDVNEDDDSVSEVPAGEERSVLLQYEYQANGKDTFTAKPSIVTKAVARAVTAAGASSIQVGGELRLKHSELGPRNKDNPSWSRPKFYEATYSPPARQSASVGAIAANDDDEPF